MNRIVFFAALLLLGCSERDYLDMGAYERLWFNRGVYCAQAVASVDPNSINSDDFLDLSHACFYRSALAAMERRKTWEREGGKP